MLINIDADTACEMLFDLPVGHKTETVALHDALYRVSAETVYAVMPVPPFDRSPYDGYAFRGDDTYGASRGHPAVLKLIGEIPAGTQPDFEITAGCAAKILTGGPVPTGADSTIKYEHTEFTTDHVSIFKPIAPDTDVVKAGSDVMPGTELVPEGTLISAPIISALANQGMSDVIVFQKPAVTVISTGSELCEVGSALRPAAIYNSNVHTLSAYVTDMGAYAVNGGVVPDEPENIAERISRALDTSDMVITTGGASVGDYDWAVTSAEQMGARVLFWKVPMKPGGAVMAAIKDGKVILGLSGNPAAAVIGLLRIAAPYIKKLCGRTDCFLPVISVALKEPFKKGSDKMRILRGRMEIADSRVFFTESIGQGSETVSSLAGCDLLGEIPIGSPPLPAGTVIKAYRLI